MLFKRFVGCVASVAVAVSPLSVTAASLSFGPVTSITTADATLAPPNSGDTLVGAVTFDGGTSQTVVTLMSSSVTFKDDLAAGAIATLTQKSGEAVAPGGNAYAPSTGNTNFDAVLSNFGYDGNPTIATINGLTPGTTYDVLLFASDDRSCCGGRTVKFGDGAGDNSGSFSLNSNSYVVATFTADAATQTVQSIGVAQTQSNFNDLVLFRQTPEPASSALLLVGGLGLLRRRRRRSIPV